MGKHIVPPTICFLIILFTLIAVLGYWNAHQSILNNGDPLPSSNNHTSYTITGALKDPQTGRYRLEFPANSYDGNLVLTVIQVNSSFTIYKNGQIHYQYAARDPHKRIQQIPLTNDFYDAKQHKLIIEYSGDPASSQRKVLLGIEQNTGGGLVIYSTLQLLSLGALFIMLTYAISLFAWKPSERYLCLFIVYLVLQLIWGGLTLLPQYTSSLYSYIIEIIINECCILVALLTVLINFGLLNIQFPDLIKKMTTWYSVVGIYTLIFIFVLIDYSATFNFFKYFRLIAGSILLIYACSQKKTGAWILLIGYAVSQALDWGYSPECIYLSYIRAAKLPFLPFTFSIMLFINFKFADKFKESERLAGELIDINKSLDRIVEERTNELKRQEALRHNMMLNVFHDLRSPLFALKGCTDIIPAESDEVKENLNIMKERIDFLTHLTDDLFLIAQLEDDKVIYASERVGLFSLLQTITSACQIEAAKKGVVLRARIDCTPLVWGDRYRLGQALQNLITNAIYYTPKNGQVTVDLQKIDQTTHILIKDTGKGISEEDIGKVFERYYHNNQNDPHQSTGLGLSIAQEIIKQHHGTITVNSKIGVGSTFEVVLPLL